MQIAGYVYLISSFAHTYEGKNNYLDDLSQGDSEWEQAPIRFSFSLGERLFIVISVADPDAGTGALLTPGSGIGK
jgi:hypothetical protein